MSDGEKSMYEQLLNGLPGMTWCGRTDAAGTYRWEIVSDGMLQYFGLTRELLERDPVAFVALVVPEERDGYVAAITRSAERFERFDWRGRMVCPGCNGAVRFIRSMASPARQADGTVLWFGQTLDVTEERLRQEELADARRAQERSEAMLKAVIEHLPMSVTVLDPTGKFLVYNAASRRLLGREAADGLEELSEAYGVFAPDRQTRIPVEVMPVSRALGGESVDDYEMFLRHGGLPEGVLISVSARPLREENGAVWAALAVSQDVTEKRKLEEELRTRNAELLVSEETKTGLIERLRYAVDELSTPVLEVWDDVLVAPIIGVIDSRRMADLVQKLLADVVRTQAQFAIVDLTGVDLVDTKTADHLIKLVRKVEVIGAQCMLTGIQPAVAQTLVDIGVDFGRLTTLRNLKHALKECLRLSRARARRLEDLGGLDGADGARGEALR